MRMNVPQVMMIVLKEQLNVKTMWAASLADASMDICRRKDHLKVGCALVSENLE